MSFIAQIDDKMETILRLINRNRVEGLKQLAVLAESGDKSAIVFLGLYLSEKAETQEAAMKWLLLADEFGNPDAAWNIAMMAREKNDLDEMKRWIDRAADLGEKDAIEARDNRYDIKLVLSKYA